MEICLQRITKNVAQKSRNWEDNRCSATHSIPSLLQNTWVHYYFHHSLSHTLSPNSFSPPTFCSHIYSSPNNITISAHMFSALQTPCWHTKMRDRKVRHWQITEPQNYGGDHGSTVVKVLCYKSKGRWFDPSWCQWIFPSDHTMALGVDSASNRNEYQEYFLGVKAAGA